MPSDFVHLIWSIMHPLCPNFMMYTTLALTEALDSSDDAPLPYMYYVLLVFVKVWFWRSSLQIWYPPFVKMKNIIWNFLFFHICIGLIFFTSKELACFLPTKMDRNAPWPAWLPASVFSRGILKQWCPPVLFAQVWILASMLFYLSMHWKVEYQKANYLKSDHQKSIFCQNEAWGVCNLFIGLNYHSCPREALLKSFNQPSWCRGLTSQSLLGPWKKTDNTKMGEDDCDGL